MEAEVLASTGHGSILRLPDQIVSRASSGDSACFLRITIVAAYSEGIPVARIAREASVSRPTVYAYLQGSGQN